VFALFLIAVWFVVAVLAPLLKKKANGQPGGVSIIYLLMITPMMCGAYWGLDTMHSRLGHYLIGGLSLFFLGGALISCAEDLHKLFRKT
jgi:hypothetical protein